MKNIRKHGLLLLLALLGGAVGVLAGRYLARAAHLLVAGKPWLTAGALLVLLPLAWLVAALVYVLGHALMGCCQDFRFHWLAVGPFRWQMREGRLCFEWNKSLNTAGGMVLSTPTGDHDLRRRFMVFAAGEPLGSAAWAGLALGAYALLPAPASEVGWLLRVGARRCSGPAGRGHPPAHARRWVLRRRGVGTEPVARRCGRAVPNGGGVDPGLLGGRRTSLRIVAGLARSRRRPAWRATLQALRPLLPLPGRPRRGPAGAGRVSPGRISPPLGRYARRPAGHRLARIGFFAVAYQHDLAAARGFMAQARPSSLIAADVWPRAEAALARLAGDAARARTQARAALQALPDNLDQGTFRFYAEWLADTFRWADAAAPPAGFPVGAAAALGNQ